MLRFLISLLLFFQFAEITLGQNSVFGKIINAENAEPLEGVTVFILHTSKGVTSDKDGFFKIEDIQPNEVELIASFLGFETNSQLLRFTQNPKLELEIKLTPAIFDLTKIEITTLKKSKRNRYLKKFRSDFLGQTSNAKKCKIINPDVLTFDVEANGDYAAKANDILKIENKATGYLTNFLLHRFERKGNQVSYSGKSFFQELETQNDKELKTRLKNRSKTYNGSIRHFLKSLFEGSLKEEGFVVFHAKMNSSGVFESREQLSEKDILLVSPAAKEHPFLQSNDILQVIYKNEKDHITFQNNTSGQLAALNLGQRAEQEMMLQGKNDVTENNSNMQSSWLIPLKKRIPFSPHGYFSYPELVHEFGYWNYEGVADLLPTEYALAKKVVDEKKKDKLEVKPSPNAPIRNGF